MDVGCNNEQLNEVQHQLKEKNSKCVILLSKKKIVNVSYYYLQNSHIVIRIIFYNHRSFKIRTYKIKKYYN